MGTESQGVADTGVGRARGQVVDDRVVGPEAAQRPTDQLGGERGVAPGDAALTEQRGEGEVGVGVLLAHADEHVVGGQPGGVDPAHARKEVTSDFGAVASQASVITSASSSRLISPRRDCWTSTAL